MSKEIKFRGFRRKTSEWVDGYLVEREAYEMHDIIDPVGVHSQVLYSVEKESVGQSTGLKDKNGREIYEGDILQWREGHLQRKDWVGLVERKDAEFVVWTSQRAYSSGGWLNVATEKVEVIGNKYEHYYLIPEILEDNK